MNEKCQTNFGLSDMGFRNAMSRTKSQGTCGIDHSFIMTSSQNLILVAKKSTIDSIVTLERRMQLARGDETSLTLQD